MNLVRWAWALMKVTALCLALVVWWLVDGVLGALAKMEHRRRVAAWRGFAWLFDGGERFAETRKRLEGRFDVFVGRWFP